jgi:hypothetical protein
MDYLMAHIMVALRTYRCHSLIWASATRQRLFSINLVLQFFLYGHDMERICEGHHYFFLHSTNMNSVYDTCWLGGVGGRRGAGKSKLLLSSKPCMQITI